MKELFDATTEKMNKTIASLKYDYGAIRAGRASAAVLEPIKVDYWGVPTPINQMAAINITEARILTIQPWDKSSLKLIEKAILASDIGINPQNDGTVIRLSFPPLTEERRKQLVKDVKSLAENAKIAIRNIRRDSIEKLKAMKKANEITEDDQKNGETKIQKITDDFVKQVDGVAGEKEAEIMEI
ncbi:MAG: ribosome recycling factor [Oscillospiraceae bacterium]|nr:ribosome recycling factor [Oscillospiraceae bacterium]